MPINMCVFCCTYVYHPGIILVLVVVKHRTTTIHTRTLYTAAITGFDVDKVLLAAVPTDTAREQDNGKKGERRLECTYS